MKTLENVVWTICWSIHILSYMALAIGVFGAMIPTPIRVVLVFAGGCFLLPLLNRTYLDWLLDPLGL